MKIEKYEIQLIDKEVYCDWCLTVAKYDGKTKMGPWGYMCNQHFKQYGIGLGLGKGQQLLIRDDYEVQTKGNI